MMHNVTTYGKEAVHEMSVSLNKPKNRYYIIVAVALLVISIATIVCGAGYTGTLFFGVSAAFCILAAIEVIGGPKKYEKMIMDQIMTSYQVDHCDMSFDIDETKITLDTGRSKKDFLNKDISKINESTNQFVLTYNGGIFLIISKNGFSEGNAEKFRTLIMPFTKKKK